jgi:hypothetical protein
MEQMGRMSDKGNGRRVGKEKVERIQWAEINWKPRDWQKYVAHFLHRFVFFFILFPCVISSPF